MPTAVDQEQGPVERLATCALGYVRDGMRVGLGSGRAASAFVRALGARVREGLAVRGVPTSENTGRLARDLGVPLAGLDEGIIDLTVDGADEVDPRLDLIKGYGGALVRERIVAAASRPGVILVGGGELVAGLRGPGRLPGRAAAAALVEAARAARAGRGRCCVALSGGSTPRRMYDILAEAPRWARLAWDRVEFFWGDERAVPPDHPESNYGAAAAALLGKLDIAPERVHRILGELPGAH